MEHGPAVTRSCTATGAPGNQIRKVGLEIVGVHIKVDGACRTGGSSHDDETRMRTTLAGLSQNVLVLVVDGAGESGRVLPE